MEEQQRIRLLRILLIIIGCLLLLKFAVQMYEAQRINEIHERASERASENEKNIEKLRQEFRDEFGKEPSF